MPTVNKIKVDTRESPPRRPSLKINAVSNWASLGVNIAIGLFLTPFIIRSLGKTGFGIWTLVGSFIGYYGLLNLGVGSAITRYIARYTAQKDENALNEVASTALAMFCVTGILAIAVSFSMAGVLADFFKVEPEQRQAFIQLIWIIGITTGISFPGNVFGAIVTAREHFVANNIITIVRALLRAGLTVLFINAGWGLLGVGLAPLAATVVAIISSFFLFEHYASDVCLRLTFTNKRTLKMLLVFGGITTIIMVADILRIQLDSLVIGKFVSLDAVGVYGVAALLIRYMTRIVTAGMGVLGPRFANLDGAGKKDEMRKLFLKSLSISSFLAFGAGMMAIIFGPRFITLWAGEEYAGAASVLIIIASAYAFALSQNPGIGLMYALNKHHYYAFFTVIEAVTNVVLSIILVFRYGIVGVALGTAISMLLVKVLVMPIYVSKIVGISIINYAKPFPKPAILAGFIIVLSYSLGFVKLLDKCTLIEFASCFIVAGLTFSGIALVVSGQFGLPWLWLCGRKLDQVEASDL